MPIANGFHAAEDENLYRFHMRTAFCENCLLFQLVDQPVKEKMFHSGYPFFTGLSSHMRKHFAVMVEETLKDHVTDLENCFVVEIGSNDGTLLEQVKSSGIRHLGIDPSENVVEVAKSKGISCKVGFFGEYLAQEVVAEFKKADLIFAANVICHLPDLKDLALGISSLLEQSGVFVFEEPYLLSMLNLTSFDQIYDEHVYIFSLHSIKNVFERFNLELFDAIPQETHGGSMRYFISKRGERKVTGRLKQLMDIELDRNIQKSDPYLAFAKRCEKKKSDLKNLLISLNEQGFTVGGYAATSKSTTVLNYCNIDSRAIKFISDSTPQKQGTFTPGSNIPVISQEEMRLNPPDYLILFAWNHEKEILAKETGLAEGKTKWISFVPEVEVLKK